MRAYPNSKRLNLCFVDAMTLPAHAGGMAPDHRPDRIAFARSLRRNATRAETLLWRALRDRRLGHLKFRRQVPIGPFTVDFFCHSRGLVLEVDGGQHCENQSDIRRDTWLHAQGLRVIRVWNSDVTSNRDGLVAYLADRLGLGLE